MFGRKKGPSLPAFSHSPDCKIVRNDPGVEIPWNEVEPGHWEATCVCGKQHHHELRNPARRLDPFDPTTSRHFGQCEHRDTTDPALLG